MQSGARKLSIRPSLRGHEGYYNGYEGHYNDYEGYYNDYEGYHNSYKGRHNSYEGHYDGIRIYHHQPNQPNDLQNQNNHPPSRWLASSPSYPPTPSPSTLPPTMGPTVTPAVSVQYTVTARSALTLTLP